MSEKIRLTQTVKKGGCAAKIPAQVLRSLLSQVKFPPASPDLIVDSGLFDDAAIFRISPTQAAVLTLDFFTPIVDSPKLFGKIAATNALSDVYAMGGQPVACMSIFAFPTASMDPQVGVELLNGACESIAEAHSFLVGGHSIDDDTLKFGLSVMGLVHPDRIWKNSGAKAGDKLILTKALGTGTLTAALKNNYFTEDDLVETWKSMTLLNEIRSLLREEQSLSIHAATDITGFGLLGHGLQMARASKMSLNFKFGAVPALPRAFESLEREFLTKAHRTNREYVGSATQMENISLQQQLLLLDPQTSGGLLLSVSSEHASGILESLKSRFPDSSLIGEVVEPSDVGPRITILE